MDTTAQVGSIDRETLTPIVRRALNSDTADIREWRASSIHNPIVAWTGGVYRFRGTADDQGRNVPWSVVLKIDRQARGGDEPSEFLYWKRELLAYQSGLLENLPGGLRAPRYLGAIEMPERAAWIWMEDVVDSSGASGGSWTASRYALAARHLGQMNGAYLVDRRLPSFPWLVKQRIARRFTEGYLAAAWSRFPEFRDHPLVRRALPGALAGRTLGLWRESNVFRDLLERAPTTLCHCDAIRRNLFSRRWVDGEQETVAVDWTYLGLYAVGWDLVPLVAGSAFLLDFEVDQIRDLDKIAFDAYVEGLGDSGWRGDPRLVRLVYVASAATRYGLLYPAWEWALDEESRRAHELAIGHAADEILDARARLQSFLLDLADEVRELLPLAA